MKEVFATLAGIPAWSGILQKRQRFVKMVKFDLQKQGAIILCHASKNVRQVAPGEKFLSRKTSLVAAGRPEPGRWTSWTLEPLF